MEGNGILQHCRDVHFPSQLRFFAAAVYGCGVGEEDMTGKRGIMVDVNFLLYGTGRRKMSKTS